jgi:hypothetical protein
MIVDTTILACAAIASAPATSVFDLNIKRVSSLIMRRENGEVEDPPFFIQALIVDQKIILAPSVMMRPVLA